METQDHRKPNQSGGHEGHSGGVHVCHKCGWPFPNPHPSARHRRAHKKVCGNVEGYKLDNDAQDKTHLMDDSDGEHVSDDEHKTLSGKVVERTISRKSSSGVGSRSSRSARSEDEVFTDAVTDFTDGPGPGEPSEGGMQRFYSMQNVNDSDFDDIKHTAENGDNLSTPSLTLKDSQTHFETVQNLEGENDRVEAGSLSQDHISSCITGPTLVSASVTVENEDADESKDFVQSKEILEIRTSENEITGKASEDISYLRANEENLGPVSTGKIAKFTGLETTGSENNIEFSQNSCSLEHPVEAVDPLNGSTSKSSDLMEDCDSKTGANDDVLVLAVPDASALPLHKNPEIVVEDLDNNREIINTHKAPGSVSETEGIAHTAEICSGDSKKFRAEDDVLTDVDAIENKLKQEVGTQSIVEQNIGEPGQIPDVEASVGDISKIRSEVVTDFKTENTKDASCAEEQKPIVSLENVSPEGATANAAENVDFIWNGAHNKSNSVQSNTEHLILQETDEREESGKELSGSSLLAECAVNNSQDSNVTGIGRNTEVIQTQLEEIKSRSGGEENEAINAEIAPGCGLGAAGSHDVIHEPLEPERISNHGKSINMADPGELMVDHSLPMMESTGGSPGREAQCIGEDGPGGILKFDDVPVSTSKIIPSDSLEMGEDAQCSLQSSAAVDDSCTKRLAEEASGVAEGGRIIKQHVAVSALDVIPDSSSQTDSLEGNWGSVSDAVMSALSDTPPAAGTPASNHSQASAAEENASLEPKPVMEVQHSVSKTPVESHAGINKMEGISEIQTFEEQQQKNSTLQTSASSSVAHVGKKNEEIIAKVTNWSTEKHHIPLKTLLGEATARSREESPIHHSHSSTSVPPKEEIPVANNGLSKTENVILSTNNPPEESSKEDAEKEWNSPARYPVNIKTEKRRAKGRGYWVPFLCCSSVNAR
ncbi:uncharacterized protein LOC104889764 isoform X2 [Beta vulgaris subsp. vulgaris]|uniref:uncharacterized protein LOC104889764 isoform X2 n=1 Tax=Beta vulgaris subsp. vulgaris TaxID=3555 RepID=UPI002036CA38|nr:uncharacterized protein LOC104889764 isoform X2 [Beta vulgaris subsp. vulgaris]